MHLKTSKPWKVNRALICRQACVCDLLWWPTRMISLEVLLSLLKVRKKPGISLFQKSRWTPGKGWSRSCILLNSCLLKPLPGNLSVKIDTFLGYQDLNFHLEVWSCWSVIWSVQIQMRKDVIWTRPKVSLCSADRGDLCRINCGTVALQMGSRANKKIVSAASGDNTQRHIVGIHTRKFEKGLSKGKSVLERQT